MAMQIHGNYDQTRSSYAEMVKERQAAERAEKAKEDSGKLSRPQDEYISSKKSVKEPVGLYRVGRDENGGRKIFYNDPNKADRTDEQEEPKADADRSKEGADGKVPKAGGNRQGKPEVCVGNTDAVEREIRKLKEKKQELEHQIQSASGDEKKIRELEKKLAQVEQELGQKDNDSYRRQHTVFSGEK